MAGSQDPEDGGWLQDLAKLKEPHITINLSFQRGLHPFYPAALKLQGPRLQTSLLAALTSHPLLLIRHWAPFMPLAQLLQLLHSYLQVWPGCHSVARALHVSTQLCRIRSCPVSSDVCFADTAHRSFACVTPRKAEDKTRDFTM